MGGFARVFQVLLYTMAAIFRVAEARKLGLLSLTSFVFGNTASARHKASCAASTIDVVNPLKDKSGLPKFSEIRPDHVLPAVEEDLATLKSGFATLEKELANPQTGETWGKRRIEYDYSSVIEKMEVLGRPLDYSWGVVGHLMGVKNSDELRSAHGEMEPEVISVTTKLSQSAAVYAALEAV